MIHFTKHPEYNKKTVRRENVNLNYIMKVISWDFSFLISAEEVLEGDLDSRRDSDELPSLDFFPSLFFLLDISLSIFPFFPSFKFQFNEMYLEAIDWFYLLLTKIHIKNNFWNCFRLKKHSINFPAFSTTCTYTMIPHYRNFAILERNNFSHLFPILDHLRMW